MRAPFHAILFAAAAAAAASLVPARGQGGAPGRVHVPDTTVENPADRGLLGHTNHLILVAPAGGLGPGGGMTPAQLQSFYGMPATGGGSVVAIVDAFHYPSALS